VADHIEVDASRGAGHVFGAGRRDDKAHLRTRVGPDGMDYKGYNIAVHEMGHNVEQVFSPRSRPSSCSPRQPRRTRRSVAGTDVEKQAQPRSRTWTGAWRRSCTGSARGAPLLRARWPPAQ
jgi:hypothetical protein